MDNTRFEAAVAAAINREKAGIGTLGEKGVHSAMKHYYEPDPTRHEIKLGSYVADIVGESGVIEIQTGDFFSLKKKLTEFLPLTNVSVVWPCVTRRRIIRIDAQTGELIDKRISPRRPGIYELFPRLIQLGELAFSERLTLIAAMLEADEYRTPVANRSRKARIKAKIDIIPTKLIEELRFECPRDYFYLIPESLPEEFTLSQLAEAAKIQKELARSFLWYLRGCGAAEELGRSGREKLYRLNKEQF